MVQGFLAKQENVRGHHGKVAEEELGHEGPALPLLCFGKLLSSSVESGLMEHPQSPFLLRTPESHSPVPVIATGSHLQSAASHTSPLHFVLLALPLLYHSSLCWKISQTFSGFKRVYVEFSLEIQEGSAWQFEVVAVRFEKEYR